MNTRNPDWLETKDLALAVPLSEAELLVSVFGLLFHFLNNILVIN